MMKSSLAVVAVVICCYLCSCNIINPAEKVPTFIYLDSIKVSSTDPGRTGTTSSKITSAWVYSDNDLVGIFGLPANIPVPIDKASTIRIAAGVPLNGIQSLQENYPFYTFDSIRLEPTPGKTIKHTGKVKYSDATKIQIVCDFETGNTFRKVNYQNTSDTTIVRTANDSLVYEGGGTGYIYLDKTHPTSENINSPDNSYKIPSGRSYLEINYKCDVELQVGLQGTVGGNPVYQYPVKIRPSENWNKMYITLESMVGSWQSSAYRVMIKASLPDDKANGFVLIDNIKIVSF